MRLNFNQTGSELEAKIQNEQKEAEFSFSILKNEYGELDKEKKG